MQRETFRSVVELGGRTATGIPVPPEVVARLGAGRRPAVRVHVGGYGYRSTVGVMGGRFLVPLSADHRSRAGVAAGDEVDVTLELDTEPREVTVPDDLGAALGAPPGARQAFDALSYSQRRSLVQGIEDAKTAATRQRRVAKAVRTVAEGAPVR